MNRGFRRFVPVLGIRSWTDDCPDTRGHGDGPSWDLISIAVFRGDNNDKIEPASIDKAIDMRPSSTRNDGLHASSPSRPSSTPTSSPTTRPSRWSILGRHGHFDYQRPNAMIESLQSALQTLRRALDRNDDDLFRNEKMLPKFLAGTLAFYTTAFSSTYAQYKFLKLSTGTRPGIIPMGVGAATVALGSWMAHLAGVGAVAAGASVRGAVESCEPVTRCAPYVLVVRSGQMSTKKVKGADDFLPDVLREPITCRFDAAFYGTLSTL